MHGLTFTENGGPPTLHLTDAAWLRGAGLAEGITPPAVLSLPNAMETKLHVSCRNPSQASTCLTMPTALASVTDVSASTESGSSVESHDSMETRPDAGTREARV